MDVLNFMFQFLAFTCVIGYRQATLLNLISFLYLSDIILNDINLVNVHYISIALIIISREIATNLMTTDNLVQRYDILDIIFCDYFPKVV